LPIPQRGQICFVKLPADPPEKQGRPVVIVSTEARNRLERALTVLVIPLSTTLRDSPTHVALLPGETGLREPSMAQCENITTVQKTSMQMPRQPLRRLSESRVRDLARCVVFAMGFLPEQLLKE
jgi:mRNA-degrading endonuclease toxin of MazEF toxin-antitoxin module